MNSLDETQTQQSRSVLVVEDDIELSSIMDRILRGIDNKIELDWATSAEDAFNALSAATRSGRKKPYDLIVADVYLEGTRTGIDLWKLCQKQYPMVPFVVTSGADLEKFSAELDSNEAGTPFLKKPFSVSDCRALFEKLLS